MFTDKNNTTLKQDEGYGWTGNLALHEVLTRLPAQEKRKYIQELKKENPTAYQEYLEWVEEYKKNFKK